MKMTQLFLGLASLLACTASPAFAIWPFSSNDNGFINRSKSSSSTTTTTTIVVRPYNAFSDMSANAIVSTSGSGSNLIPLSLLGMGVGGTNSNAMPLVPLGLVAPQGLGGYPAPHMLSNTYPQPYYGYGYSQPCVPYPDYGYYPAQYYPPVAWYPPPPPYGPQPQPYSPAPPGPYGPR